MGKNKPLNAIKENKTGYLYQAITCVDCQGIIQKGKKIREGYIWSDSFHMYILKWQNCGNGDLD